MTNTGRELIELIKAPYWLLVLSALTLAGLPWVRWSRHYSLRAFLIVTMMMAVLFALIVIAS
jgi:hypothetical protein